MDSKFKRYLAFFSTAILFNTAVIGGLSATAHERSSIDDDLIIPVETMDNPTVDKGIPVESPLLSITDVNRLPMLGDIDGDATITASDALISLRAAVGLQEEFTDRYYSGDVDGDRIISTYDALKILRKSVGIEDEFLNEPLTDVVWYKIDADYYAENTDGVPIIGLAVIDGYRCGFDDCGKLLTEKTEIDGTEYDFLPNGVLLEGWQFTKQGKSYYQDGIMFDGWSSIYGVNYYFVDGMTVSGWKTVDGVKKYFDANGAAAVGWREIDGKHYYFDNEGNPLCGLVNISGKKYYLYSYGDYFVGWKTVGETKYFFTNSGSAATGEYTIDDTIYHFEPNGAFLTGFCDISGKKHYKDNFGFDIKGWFTLNGNRYYFDENGEATVGSKNIDGIVYRFSNDGIMQNGWVENNGFMSYLANNELVTGEYSIDGKRYLFDNNGCLRTGLYYIDGKSYYGNSYGFPVTGWQDVNGERYYFDSDGTGVNGFKDISGNKYYFENGKMFRNTSVKLYTIDNNGVCTRITTITGSTAKYRAEEIIAAIGTNPDDICSYVINNMTYYYVRVSAVYDDPHNADWATIAAYPMNRGYGACYHFSAYMDQLFHAAGYKTRIIVGTGYGTGLHSWNQIYLNNKWVNYDAGQKFFGVSTEYLKSVNWTFDNYIEPSY